MIVTSEYIFLNPKLNEIKDIINNTRLEHDQKYGDNYCRKIEVGCNFKLFNKIKNKTKKITTIQYHGVKKSMVASQGKYELNKPNKLIILIERTIYKNVIDT